MDTVKRVKQVLDQCRDDRDNAGKILYYAMEAVATEAIAEAKEMLETAERMVTELTEALDAKSKEASISTAKCMDLALERNQWEQRALNAQAESEKWKAKLMESSDAAL